MIKAHPGFFHSKFPTKNMRYDRKLFYEIISKYEHDLSNSCNKRTY